MNAQTPIELASSLTMVTVHEAKTHLSRLLARVEAGEEIIVARGAKPIAKLVPLAPEKAKRRELGWLAHEAPPGVGDIIGPAFWEPLNDEDIGLSEEQLSKD